MALLTTSKSFRAFVFLTIIFGFCDPFGYACSKPPSRPYGNCRIEVWTRKLGSSSSKLNRLHHWGIVFYCPNQIISFDANKGDGRPIYRSSRYVSETSTKALKEINKSPDQIENALREDKGPGLEKNQEIPTSTEYNRYRSEENGNWTISEAYNDSNKSPDQMEKAAGEVRGSGSGELLTLSIYIGKQLPGGAWKTKKSCGGVSKTPSQIEAVARKVKGLGEKYSLGFNNCQDFVERLYKDLTRQSLKC